MKEPHRFSIYAANRLQRSVNFGIVATYRQLGAGDLPVGELVKTVPLAPKETRRFSKRTSVRRSRAEKEVVNTCRHDGTRVRTRRGRRRRSSTGAAEDQLPAQPKAAWTSASPTHPASGLTQDAATSRTRSRGNSARPSSRPRRSTSRSARWRSTPALVEKRAARSRVRSATRTTRSRSPTSSTSSSGATG